MAKFVRIIFGIVLVGAATYFLFGQSRSFSYKIPGLNLDSENILSAASTTVESIKGKAENIFSGIASKLQDKGEELISSTTAKLQSKGEELALSAMEKAKDYAIETLKGGIETGIDKIEEKAGLSIDSLSDSVPQNVIYSVKKGTFAYFTIKNVEEGLLKYDIDWFDGGKSSGQLTKKDEFKTLPHKWANEGDYPVTFKMVDSNGEKEYKILIIVLN